MRNMVSVMWDKRNLHSPAGFRLENADFLATYTVTGFLISFLQALMCMTKT